MTDIKIHFNNHSYATVEADGSILREMAEYFSFEMEGARFDPRVKYGQWDGRIRLMGSKGELPFGLVSSAVKFASDFDYSVWVDPKFNPEPIITREEFDQWIQTKEIYSGSNKITPHWYQADTVFEVINNRRNIANLPTSAGKSLIAALLSRWYLENFNGKVLVLVPNVSLVGQMKDDCVDYRLFPPQAINLVGGGAKNQRNNTDDALITVSTWQSAIKKPKEWFDQFGMLICDEVHTATGKNISDIVKSLVNCEYKIGMSGSLRDGKANIMQYVALFGEIFRPVDTAKLIEDGQVADLEIKSVILRYKDEECQACEKLDYQQEVKYVINHKKRNAWICSLAKKLADRNENVLLLFRFTSHGKAMYESLRETHGERVHFIAGETKTEIRNSLRGVAENETGLIIVASLGVMSTGVSIKQLHHLVFAAGVKSKVLVLQSIGRVLRKHGSKSKAVVWDIVDNLAIKSKSSKAKNPYKKLNYLFRHGIERIARYNSERFNYTTAKIDL